MIAAPLTLPQIRVMAQATLQQVSDRAQGRQASVSNCHKQSSHVGACHFSIVVTTDHTSRCAGTIQVRNVGKGPESRFAGVVCKAV